VDEQHERCVVQHNQIPVSSNDTVPTGDDPSRPVILVIDDEEMILSLLQEVLDLEGYTVLLAMNGEAGLARVLEAHPDLILTDMMMPIMDGHELCRRLRANQRTATIPLICMSAAYRPAADDAFDAIIAKPFDLDSLLALIHVWLGGGQ
jgi:CheY-like chemotaxis protein